jgi:hypothetical protein
LGLKSNSPGGPSGTKSDEAAADGKPYQNSSGQWQQGTGSEADPIRPAQTPSASETTASSQTPATQSSGKAPSPIYSEEGEFLGTDDQGLKGDAIVMDKKYFKQGMSHKEAIQKGVGTFNINTSFSNIPIHDIGGSVTAYFHYLGLSGRPDYDGILTFAEAVSHYSSGMGTPLYVDVSKIDLSGPAISDFEIGVSKGVNFLNPGFLMANMTTRLVYGGLSITLIDNSGHVFLGAQKSGGIIDNYDFTSNGGSWYSFREVTTWMGAKINGDLPFLEPGVPFKIYGYGRAKLGRSMFDKTTPYQFFRTY